MSTPPASASSPRRARWPAVLLVLLALAALGGLSAWLLQRNPAGAQPGGWGGGPGGPPGGGRPGGPSAADHPVTGRTRVTVGTAVAQQGQLPILVDALGTITPLASVSIAPQVSGLLEQVLFTEGQMVKKGDLLARIDPRPYEQALAQARAQQAQQQAQLESARNTLRRYQALWKEDSIARQDLDNQAAQVQQLQAAVQAAAASVQAAQINLGHTRITAPISGRMGLRALDEGNLASSGASIATLTQMQPMDVLFSIPQDHVPAVLAAQQAGQALPVQAFDRARAHEIALGRFSTLDNQIDAATGSARAKARFDNPASGSDAAPLFPNQFVNVRLQLGQREGVLAPVTAVRTGPQGHYVFVIDEAGVAHQRAVTPGLASAEYMLITSGLHAGEQLGTEGGDRVRDGGPVQTADSAPAPDPAASGERRRRRSAGGRPPASAPSAAPAQP